MAERSPCSFRVELVWGLRCHILVLFAHGLFLCTPRILVPASSKPSTRLDEHTNHGAIHGRHSAFQELYFSLAAVQLWRTAER